MDRLETARDRREPAHHRHRDHHAGPHAEGRRYRRGAGCAGGKAADADRPRGIVRDRLVLHPDLLRFVCAADHRQETRALPDRGAVELHQLRHRSQYRRHRIHRRRDPLPHLFGLRTDRDRRRKDLLSIRPDVLARQPVRAGDRHGVASLGGQRHGPAAAVHQPGNRARLPRRHRGLSGLDFLRQGTPSSLASTAGRWCCRRRG